MQGITKFDSSKEDSATYSSIRRAFKMFVPKKNYKQPDILFYVANYIPEYLGPNC